MDRAERRRRARAQSKRRGAEQLQQQSEAGGTGGKSRFTSIPVGNDMVLAVAMEAQLRSQGIRVERLNPYNQHPASYFQYQLVVASQDVPHALEILEELSGVEPREPKSSRRQRAPRGEVGGTERPDARSRFRWRR